ncbi:F420-dependent methylenetetrahydromethanopterin dehydrogenase [Archaeoglobus veneficus]|uniref:F420-dependent methylenetetrahydromethanopterin dehydrogenase n=1 Tax=Archaeoglobus veneficus (strain DSM 11195 / SNP6) TaxID=693661 RepID=F2KNE0_ARCVS|nr:F420-dependent methylenetetrahydromethanopterin dehydrogenase [Archaeoglobus veneficus]AEA47342.1 F420-dependent methylenetetrahydromethanopterin dehydrogenase [Archaeoglobus veneficus SNP6]
MRIGIIKLGAIATALLIDYMLDERADREDIDVRTITSGSKLRERDAEIVDKMREFNPDLVIVASPNAALPAAKLARDALKAEGKPVIVISDAPAKKVKDELEAEGFGYILVNADSMIGARREFLDPTEMCLYNSDVIKVLAATGAFRAVQLAVDEAIESAKAGKPKLPRLIIDAEAAVNAGNFSNPYARAKAMAAYTIAEKVAAVTTKACFVEKDAEKYIPMVAAAHEMMRYAAKLAEEAREIEKSSDAVYRTPHAKDGRVLSKWGLMEKPS